MSDDATGLVEAPQQARRIVGDLRSAASGSTLIVTAVIHGNEPAGLRATYQGRDITLLEPFAGPNGTVFITSRSLDWCPFCMRQMVQLQEHKTGFDAAGIGLVAITYDDPLLQQQFIDKFGITIPILSDRNGLSFKRSLKK